MGGRRAIGNAKWELYDLSNDISEEKISPRRTLNASQS